MNCKITLWCQLKWSFYIPLGNYKSGEFSTWVFHPAGQKKSLVWAKYQGIETCSCLSDEVAGLFHYPSCKFPHPYNKQRNSGFSASPKKAVSHGDRAALCTPCVSFTPSSSTKHLDPGPSMHQWALSRLHVCFSWPSSCISLFRNN